MPVRRRLGGRYIFMKIFVVDKCGWVDVHVGETSVEESLEPIDIKNNEYRIININGYMYKWKSDLNTYCGFKLLITDQQDIVLLTKLKANQRLEQFKI